MSNLRSVVKALEHVADKATRVVLTTTPDEVLRADRVVFPGQGAARDCMRALKQSGLDEAIITGTQTKPFLGICLGLQVLFAFSEENDGTPCLGIYPGSVKRLGESSGERLKIPHMGWNTIRQVSAHPLWRGIPNHSWFYFVHSFYVSPADAALTAGTTDYGTEFPCAIARDNVFALQPHPEKSQQAGLSLLRNFIHWDG